MYECFGAAISPPCITARRGGRAINKNVAQRPLIARPGWFRWMQKENHPGCVAFGGFATFFLMTQPPLLAVMQGGEKERLIPGGHQTRPLPFNSLGLHSRENPFHID